MPKHDVSPHKPPLHAPGVEVVIDASAIKTIDDAVHSLRQSGLEGWDLVAAASGSSLKRCRIRVAITSTRRVRRSFMAVGTAITNALALQKILRRLGISSDVVAAMKCMFPPARIHEYEEPERVSGHTWLSVTIDGTTKDVCPGDITNVPGHVHFTVLTPRHRYRGMLRIGGQLGSIVTNTRRDAAAVRKMLRAEQAPTGHPSGSDKRPSPPQLPAPRREALAAIVRCCIATLRLLMRREYHIVHDRRGMWLTFADGSSSSVFRETVTELVPADPCVLVVTFRLRFVHGAGHAVFRVESILNTLLFAGFPGYAVKLWLDHDENETYRGVYEWDGSALAEHYARCLWRVLALVSVRGSIGYAIVPRVRMQDVLVDPRMLERERIPDRFRILSVQA